MAVTDVKKAREEAAAARAAQAAAEAACAQVQAASAHECKENAGTSRKGGRAHSVAILHV